MEETQAVKAIISERRGRDTIPVCEVFMPKDRQEGKAHYSNPRAAKRLGLKDIKIPTKNGHITEYNGVEFVRHLYLAFQGNSMIVCDPPTEGKVEIAPSRHERKAPRGEPSRDPMEDIEGQYQRFQQRENQL